MHLDPAPAVRSAQCPLVRFQPQPPGPVDPPLVTPGQHLGDVRAGRPGAPGPAAAVSAPSGLLDPMMPLGPRLSQPATYRPGTVAPPATTRPASLGTVPVASLNG